METKNLIRQNFISEDVNTNKAEVLANRYTDLYQDITVSYIPKYATYGRFDQQYLPDNEYPEELFVNIDDLNIKSHDILINLVDNEGFKKKLDHFNRRVPTLLFAAGVNLFNGQVYFTTNRKTNGYVTDHSDLMGIFDEVSIHACADTDANGSDDNPEQLFNGNDIAASLLSNIYQSVLTDVITYKRINFISGNNINVSTALTNYSYLAYICKNILANADEDYAKAVKYINVHGTDKTTSISKFYYDCYNKFELIRKMAEIYN